MDKEKIAEDKVFLALTRPSVFMGLPLEAILPIIMVCMVVWGIVGNPFYPLALFGALYFPARMIVHYDFNAFRLWGLWFQTTFVSKNRTFWGGGSYSPVRLKTGVKRRQFGND
ncbi:type IV secretion system protein VirB3 [Sphingomonas sp. IC081]|uniref:type IV secretion system protein VirB3 n=1 Tax=Sphingomonas sp. IC081 TaxID=304378 RepID=UPI0011578B09|nr:VirB3 family type IV secretion system protein [Sphingomonas sp. IC081]QDK35998.1 type VI secretion protein [Sphingomonas sp. IC081]